MNKPVQIEVKTEDLLRRADGARPVAEFLGITTQAVYGWGEFVPPLRVYQLREARPQWFRDTKTKVKAA